MVVAIRGVVWGKVFYQNVLNVFVNFSNNKNVGQQQIEFYASSIKLKEYIIILSRKYIFKLKCGP